MRKVTSSSGSSESVEQGAGASTSANGRDFEVVLGKWLKTSGTGKTEAEVRDLTEKTVDEFASAADQATRFGWIVPGKLVCAYVALLQPSGPKSHPDPYEILGSHPDTPYEASHLRNLAEAYRLWEEFGGEGKAPKLGIGFFALVINGSLDRDDKKRFLAEAIKNKWTTRQLKAAVKAFLTGATGAGAEGKAADSVPSDWADLDGPLKKVNAVISGLRSHRPAGDLPKETAQDLRVLYAAISDILLAYNSEESRD